MPRTDVGALTRAQAMGLRVGVLALVVATVCGAASFAGWSAAGLLAWAIAVFASRSRALRQRLEDSPTWAEALTAFGLVAVSLVALAPGGARMLRHEALDALWPRVHDALRGGVLAPRLVRFDQPQTFFARSADAVELCLGSECAAGVRLGPDLVRFEVRLSAVTERTWDERAVAVLRGPGGAQRFDMLAVRPLAHPQVAAAADERFCVVSQETDEVAFGPATAPLLREPTLDGPVGCALVGEGAVVAHAFDRALLFLPSQRRVELPWAAGAIAAHGDSVFVAGCAATCSLLRLRPNEPPLAVPVVGVPHHIAATATGVVVATRQPSGLAVFSHELVHLAHRRLAQPAVGLAARHDRVAITATDFNLDGTGNLGNHFVDGRVVIFDAALRVLEEHSTPRRTARQDRPGDVDSGLGPAAIAWSGDDLWLAFSGSLEIGRLTAGQLRVWDLRDHGMPTSVHVAAGRVLVASAPDGWVMAFDAARGPVWLQRWAPDDRALLRDEPDALRLRWGEHAFREATRAGISCESCHPGGGSDGALHNIGGRVLTPTLDARGMLGTAPFLRDGSYATLEALHSIADDRMRGYRTIEGDRAATRAAYLASLALPPVHSVDLERERRGYAVFLSAGCGECHVPPRFTSGGRFAARDLFPDGEETGGLDVPSLRGLRGSAPYLVDGRAGDLGAVLTTSNLANRHGDTAGLDGEERAALVAFLESL